MGSVNDIAYSSFLAGAFLTRRNIAYLECSMLETEFGNRYDIDFAEYDFDYYKLQTLFYIDENGFHLKYGYSEKVVIDNIEYNVYDLLYSLTNDIVRDYFDIHKIINLDEINHLHRRKRGLF